MTCRCERERESPVCERHQYAGPMGWCGTCGHREACHAPAATAVPCPTCGRVHGESRLTARQIKYATDALSEKTEHLLHGRDIDALETLATMIEAGCVP